MSASISALQFCQRKLLVTRQVQGWERNSHKYTMDGGIYSNWCSFIMLECQERAVTRVVSCVNDLQHTNKHHNKDELFVLINCGDDLYFVAAQKRQNQKQSFSLFIQNLGHQEYVYIIEYDPNFFKLTSFSRKSIKLSELFLKDKR